MKTVRTAAEVRAALAPARRSGRSVGLVPTMGALHAGHLSLIRRARQQCDEVVVSVFVNPAQFNELGDLAAYPRDEDRDVALARDAGAELVFAPAVADIYPDGFATTVRVAGPLTAALEGAERGAAHFDGVATVVTKLLNIVGPDVAYFGQKDAQQAAVVRRLVADLQLPVAIEVCPTVRDADGLALSSRNAHLSPKDRGRALSLSRALHAAAERAAAGACDPTELLAAARAQLDIDGVHVEYVALVEPESFQPVAWLSSSALLAVAARVGSTRLIDNTVLEPARQVSLAGSLSPSETEQPCSV